MSKKALLYSISAIFIFLFLYTGIEKLSNSEALSIQMKEIPFLKPFAGWLIALVAILELLVAILLVRKSSRLTGMYACLILMILFTLYLIIVWYSTDGLTCSCGGFLTQLPQNIHIMLNISLAGLAIAGIRLEKQMIYLKRHRKTENVEYT
jgi:uncharacterized membrane protein YphA (DoxX/SURF4 family)